MEASRGVPQKTSKCKCSLTPRCSESFHRAHAMRGNARKILPSTAVRSSNWRASGPLTSGAALAASSWRIWCRALASNNRAASLKEPSDVARIPQSSLNGLQGRSLLQSAQAGNRGTKEVEQQEADVLVVEQLAVAGPITLGTDVFESRQQGHQRVEILQAFNVTRLQSSSTWSGHRCLHAIPEILRVRMKASRKY